MEKKNLIIIGGGPGGYVAAIRAGQAGLDVLLAEKRAVGGVCLNEGCIPSKALLNSAKIYDHTRHGAKYGVGAENISLDHAAVVKRKAKVVKTLVSGIRSQVKKANGTIIDAEAVIKGKVEGGFAVEIDGQEYLAEKLIIASGSQVLLPNLPGLAGCIESGFAITSREILDLETVPERLVIVGGGVIGLEMAAYYHTAGSEVTIVEMLDHIGGEIDRDIAAVLLQHYQKAGTNFQLNCRVTSFEDGAVHYEGADGAIKVEADKVLVSIGRKPVTEGFGLETLGLTMERGAIVTDEYLRTNVENVYAIGDVNGKWLLAHTASREGEVAINHIIGKQDKMSYAAIPQVIYTMPEVGAVGETVQTAEAKGLKVKSVSIPMAFSGRYLAENDMGKDFCRVVAEEGSGRILGVSMITPYASEIIYGAGMMVEQGLTIDQAKTFVFPHPTVGEIIREALFEFE